MNIRELIEILSDFNQDYEIRISENRKIHEDCIREDHFEKTIYLR